MKYLEKKDIQDFDIMLSATDSWLSKMIRFFIRNKASHAAVFFKLDNMLYVYESEKHGLTNTDFSHYMTSKYRIWVARPKVRPTPKQKKDLLHLAVSTAGHKTYDYANLLIHQPVKIITNWIFGKPLWVGRKKKKAGKHFVCSELVAYVMDKFFGLEPSWNLISTEHFFLSNDYEIYKLKK